MFKQIITDLKKIVRRIRSWFFRPVRKVKANVRIAYAGVREMYRDSVFQYVASESRAVVYTGENMNPIQRWYYRQLWSRFMRMTPDEKIAEYFRVNHPVSLRERLARWVVIGIICYALLTQ